MKRTPIKLKLRQSEIDYLLKLQTEIRLKKYKAKFDSDPTEANRNQLQIAQMEFDIFHDKENK